MLQYPAVVVHGLADARIALGVGMPVMLLSAPGAALYAGCGWWRALIAHARAEFADAIMTDALDCADASGLALAALRIGQHVVVLTADAPGWTAVAAIAGAWGGRVLAERPPALDLAGRGAFRHLPSWLRGA